MNTVILAMYVIGILIVIISVIVWFALRAVDDYPGVFDRFKFCFNLGVALIFASAVLKYLLS